MNLIPILSTLLAAASLYAQNTATVNMYCLSLEFLHAEYDLLDATYFTTYDGSAGLPLFDTVSGSMYFSGELAPAGAGAYRTDYIEFHRDQIGGWGTVTLSFPTADADGNGVPDFLQCELPGSVSFSGTFTAQFPASGSAPVTGRLTRAAHSSTGSYTVVLQGETSAVTFSGTARLRGGAGQIAYTRWPTNIFTTASVTNFYTGASMVTNDPSAFTVLSANQIQFSSGVLEVTKAVTLTRSGSRYIGAVQPTDGNLATSWPDYTQWVVQIDDPNDSNGNGIPDLTDVVLPPARPVLSSPRLISNQFALTVQTTPGARYRLESSADFHTWLPLQTTTALDNRTDFIDVNSLAPRRYYRVVIP